MTLPVPRFRAIDPANYLELARSLLKQQDSCSQRLAIDRAYYAAFLKTRDELEAKNYIVAKHSPEDHAMMPEYLKTFVRFAIGNNLLKLRRVRNTVSYENRDLFDQTDRLLPVPNTITMSAEIITCVCALPRRVTLPPTC